MKIIRNIYIVCLLLVLCSITVDAQIGKTKIVLASGDTTLLVNPISKGLEGEDSRFLNKDKRFDNQQVFVDIKTDYTSLEEAAYDTDLLLKKLTEDTQELTNDGNSSLSYRATQVNRMKDAREKQVQSIIDSMLVTETISAEDIALKYIEFGDKPTYYINDYKVAPSVPDLLSINEVLTRMVKVRNVISGNPNGEVWLTVTPKAFNRLVHLGYIKEDQLQ